MKCDMCKKELKNYALTPEGTVLKLDLDCASKYQKLTSEEKTIVNISTKIRNGWKGMN